MSSSCGDGGCTTKYGTDRLSVPNIAAKACYEPLRHQWISEAKMLWLCIFMVNFSGRLRQLVRSSLCGPRRGIPLLTPRLPHTCYEEGPRQVLAGSPKFPVPSIISSVRPKNFPVWFQREFDGKLLIRRGKSRENRRRRTPNRMFSRLFSRFTGIRLTQGSRD
jgi:hypothetical protein